MTIHGTSSLKNTIINRSANKRSECGELNDPLKILTGEGHMGAAEWLTWGGSSGESNMVASGMDRVGELDPAEVGREAGVLLLNLGYLRLVAPWCFGSN